MLKQYWDNVVSMLKQRWNDLCNVENSCINVVQSWTPTLSQCCTILKIWCWILFHFKRRINFIWAVICNIETTLIRCWNADMVLFMKKLTLRNILLQPYYQNERCRWFFKDCAKTFTTPVFTNIFWWLLLGIRLRLVFSNSSSLQKVPF